MMAPSASVLLDALSTNECASAGSPALLSAVPNHAADLACLRKRSQSLIRRPRGLGVSAMSVTNLAPPRRRSSTILRLWNASSSGRCPTLTTVKALRYLVRSPVQVVLLLG